MIVWLPLLLAGLATAVGLLNLASGSADLDGATGAAFHTQLLSAAVAVVVGVAVSRVRVARMRRLAFTSWGVSVGALAVVLAIGAIGGGARSWLLVGGSSLQPSELMKLVLPIALAAELATKRVSAVRRVLVVGVLVAVPVGLIAAQPDMGAVGLLVLGAGTVIWLAGLPWWVTLAGALSGALMAPIAWVNLAPYQQARILTFLDPTRDPTGAGYQTLQSLYAVASGGWLGVGWMAGTQGRLGFLPEHETDFILAVLAEEWGVLGATLALTLLFGLMATGLVIAWRARDRFVALLAAGLAAQLLWQVVVNAGGVLGLVPLTGVTLPFLSRGGSSLLVAWASAGVWSACARTVIRHRPLLSDAAPLPRYPIRLRAPTTPEA